MPTTSSNYAQPTSQEVLFPHNLVVESFFSAFNGIFLGLILFAAPVVAVVGMEVSPLELTILVSAFPVGAFLGPFWAYLGRNWGMKNLVTIMMILGSLPLLAMFWVTDAAVFTAILTFSQLMNSAMRMGQSSLYRLTYPENKRGAVLGRFTFWTYLTMVPSVLVTGWLLDKSREMYQVIYPLAGICGLVGCVYYQLLRIPEGEPKAKKRVGFRKSVENIENILGQDRLYRLFQAAFFLSGASFFMSQHVVILLTRERFGFGAFELSLCLAVIPQLLLAISSPWWGRILDRIGIIRCRMLISILLTAALASYFGGLVFGMGMLIYLGGIFQGISNSGGQLTWFLASSQFAPRTEDVPLYNGIHFVLNGVRGLLLPWIGSIMFVLTGTGAVLTATLISSGSIPILLRALRLKDHRLSNTGYKTRNNSEPTPASRRETDSISSTSAIPFAGKAS